MPLSQWSTTAADNDDAATNINWAENQSPSTVNNSARQLMADVRSWYEDVEWRNLGHTVTRTGNTTFTIATDVTATYVANRPIRCTDSSTLYGIIASSSYSAPNTTVTVTLDSGNLSASLSAVSLGPTPTNQPIHVSSVRSAATTSTAQTLTNKTIDLASNTVTGTAAQFNTALSDDNFATLAAANTFSANQTIQSTDAGAAGGPFLFLDRNSASPATNDVIGQTFFRGRNSVGSTIDYVNFETVITDATNGSEDAKLNINGYVGGANTLLATIGAGMQLGSPTGGDKGTGTVNAASTIYQNNVAVPTISSSDTLTNKTVNLSSNTLTGTTAQFNTALSDGDFATLAGSETLTNKTVNLSSNTLTGTTAQFNTALSDGDFATLAGTETLTNKTLTSPTITGATIGVASGVAFPATQSASADANTLDDYEEGTWTPTLNFSGDSTGIAYTTQSGYYTKIGRFVMAQFDIVLSSKGSATGSARIGGLPFTIANISTDCAISFSSFTNSFVNMIGQALATNTRVDLYGAAAASTGNRTAINNTDFSNTSEVRGVAIYHV